MMGSVSFYDKEDIELIIKALRDLQEKSIKDRYNHCKDLIEKLEKKIMKFRVIHEDYWPVPEYVYQNTIQDDLSIDQARELLRTLQKENPKNEYFICESKDETYFPLEGYGNTN